MNPPYHSIWCFFEHILSHLSEMDVEAAGGIDLESLGLPIANDENKKLEADVQRKEKEISRLLLQIEEHSDRIQAISDHLKNVRQELQQTQVRVCVSKNYGRV